MRCKEIELLLFLVALQLYIYEYPERALKDKKKKILPVRCFSVLYRHVWGELIT